MSTFISLEDWAVLALKDPWGSSPALVARAVKSANLISRSYGEANRDRNHGHILGMGCSEQTVSHILLSDFELSDPQVPLKVQSSCTLAVGTAGVACTSARRRAASSRAVPSDFLQLHSRCPRCRLRRAATACFGRRGLPPRRSGPPSSPRACLVDRCCPGPGPTATCHGLGSRSRPHSQSSTRKLRQSRR